MGILLEIKVGPMAGKKIPCRMGDRVAVGRDPARSQFVVANDKHMSGIHFTVECGEQGVRVVDRQSSNGTFLNGKRIKDAAPVSDGDEIRSGETVFLVHLTPDERSPGTRSAPPRFRPVISREPVPSAPRLSASPVQLLRSSDSSLTASAKPVGVTPSPRVPAESLGLPAHFHSRFAPLSVGSWTFNSAPQDWDVQEGFGLHRRVLEETFPSTLVVTEEPLGSGVSFASYVESQIDMVRKYLREPRIDPATSPDIKGAEEKIAFDVRHKTKDDVEIFYRRIYARCDSTVGVLTLTTLDKESAEVLQRLETFWAGLSFIPKERQARPSQVPEP